MKRTDITELFPEATDEQIKTLMDINGADINSAKKGMTDLQAQLTAAQEENQRIQSAVPSEDTQKQLEALRNELEGMKQAETMRAMREKVANEKGIPVSLLTGEDEEACAAPADALLTFAKGFNYPTVPDGGEVKNPGITKADILALPERQRLKAIQEHIDLFS
jgi:antitoxin component of RelBE/YafQ-DinJ toxin-antitoxin module